MNETKTARIWDFWTATSLPCTSAATWLSTTRWWDCHGCNASVSNVTSLVAGPRCCSWSGVNLFITKLGCGTIADSSQHTATTTRPAPAVPGLPPGHLSLLLAPVSPVSPVEARCSASASPVWCCRCWLVAVSWLQPVWPVCWWCQCGTSARLSAVHHQCWPHSCELALGWATCDCCDPPPPPQPGA